MLGQGGFAASVAAHNGDEAALFDVQGDPIQRHALFGVLYVHVAVRGHIPFRVLHVIGKRHVFQLYDRFFAHNQISIT